jgi:hypothetical protein
MKPSAIATPAHTLPPLILHPFSDLAGPALLLESSRASLMLQRVPAGDTAQREELDKKILDGRFCEIRMLFYVGKDVNRWIEQCLECTARVPELRRREIEWQSFARFLIEHTPEDVKHKLCDWGVVDYKALFMRGLGLHSVFAEVPERSQLTDGFIRNYYHFADQMYECAVRRSPGASLAELGCEFKLYASGEYARMLEQEWANSIA